MSNIVDIDMAKMSINLKINDLDKINTDLNNLLHVVEAGCSNCSEKDSVLTNITSVKSIVEELKSMYAEDIEYITNQEDLII